MNDGLIQNNIDFISLSNYISNYMNENQNFDYINQDEVNQLYSLTDRSIGKLQSFYNPTVEITNHYIEEISEETKKISASSIFSLISQSLFILMQNMNANQNSGSNDELILSFNEKNEELKKENFILKNKLTELTGIEYNNELSQDERAKIVNDQDMQNILYHSSDDNTEEIAKFNEEENENENEEENEKNSLFPKLCQKLKLPKVETEGEFVKIVSKELNRSRMIKKDLIRHFNLNVKSEVPLSKIIQNLDRQIKKDSESHSALKQELKEATDSISQLKEELDYITKRVLKKEEKVKKLREERNEARNQLNELLETIKQSNYNTSSYLSNNDQKDSQKEIELEEARNDLEKAQNSIRKKNQKIEKMKRKIQSLEENVQLNTNSNSSSSFDKYKSRSIQPELFDNDSIEKVKNSPDKNGSLEIKKESIELKNLLAQKDDQIANLKSFIAEIASSYEATTNELAEESKNKCELAKCVQLLLSTNKILESLLETSNQQKEELKQQLNNSIFKAQNSDNNSSQSDDDMTKYPKNSSQFILSKIKKITDEVLGAEDKKEPASEIVCKIIQHSNDKPGENENNTDSIIDIYRFALDSILLQEEKLNEANNSLKEEKNFTANLYTACLGQLRFILNISSSKMIQSWIFGEENEEWIRENIQTQAARMENFLDKCADSCDDSQILSLNKVQKIEKGIFEELLPLAKETGIGGNVSEEDHVGDAFLVPLSSRINEFLNRYKENLSFKKMSGENKDLYLMLVQSIAANNVLQLLATETGNRCKSQFFEIRNLQSQINFLNQNKGSVEAAAAADDHKSDNDDEKNESKKKIKKTEPRSVDVDNQNQEKIDSVYKEINNIKNILRKTVSKVISNDGTKPPFSELFICLKCIEKAESVTFNNDKYVRKLEKQLLKLDAALKKKNDLIILIKDQIKSLGTEFKSKITDHEETVNMLNKQLSSKENELKAIKEAILMLNIGDSNLINEIKKEEGINREIIEEEEEEKNEKVDIRDQYEKIVNVLQSEIDDLEQKMKKMAENSKSEIELIKDKSKKKQSKLLSTINFLTNQKKEVEEEQAKEREQFRSVIEQNQAECSQLKQKIDELNKSFASLNDKASKLHVENKLLKSRLKNEEEKSERERSLFESRLKLNSFSIENSMKDQIEEVRQQQQSKLRDLIVFIFNLFNDEVELLMKNEKIEFDVALLDKETQNSVYSLLQSIKTKMQKLEKNSFASDYAINELNDVRKVIENFLNSNNERMSQISSDNKCSKILNQILNDFSQKVDKFEKHENELKKLKIDSTSSSKILQKAREAIDWENWYKRIQRFITDGFGISQFSPTFSDPLSPSQALKQRSNNDQVFIKPTNPKEMRNKLEEAIFSSVNGDTKKLLRKIEILRTEKKFFMSFGSDKKCRQCISSTSGDFDENNRNFSVSIHHLIIMSVSLKRIEKLSGNVQPFFTARRRNPNGYYFDDDEQTNSGQLAKKSSKPIFSQFVSPI